MPLTKEQTIRLIANDLQYGKEDQRCPTCQQPVKGKMIVDQPEIMAMKIVASLGTGTLNTKVDWGNLSTQLGNFIRNRLPASLTGDPRKDAIKIVEYIKINYPNIIKTTNM